MPPRRSRIYRRAATKLPDQMVRLLLKAPYAHVVARIEADQIKLLPEIVSLHTKQELSTISGVGPVAAHKLENWLTSSGRRLRRPTESLETAVCRLSIIRRRRPTRPDAALAVKA